MAVIDLRSADVFIKDGTDLSSTTTTLTAGVAKGASTDRTSVLPFTATTGFAVGDGITVGGSLEYYAIQGIDTLDVTVAPALTQAFLSGTTVTGVSQMLEVHIGEGTLTYSEKRSIVNILNRGHIYTVKLGDDAPVEVRMQFIWEFLRSPSGSPPTVEEALKQIGNASGWASTATDPCEPYCVDLVICWAPPCVNLERYTLGQFRWSELNHDLKAGTVDVSGTCNIAFATIEHDIS